MRSTYLIGIAFSMLTACPSPTRFEGDAKFPNGVAGCQRACEKDGLEFGGFVYSGEFATSCVCQSRRGAGAPAASAELSPTAGVVVQTQAAAAAAAAANAEQLRRQQLEQERQERQRQEQERQDRQRQDQQRTPH